VSIQDLLLKLDLYIYVSANDTVFLSCYGSVILRMGGCNEYTLAYLNRSIALVTVKLHLKQIHRKNVNHLGSPSLVQSVAQQFLRNKSEPCVGFLVTKVREFFQKDYSLAFASRQISVKSVYKQLKLHSFTQRLMHPKVKHLVFVECKCFVTETQNLSDKY